MKNKLFYLMLNAVVFTTSPLFAMLEEEKSIKPIHQCASCHDDLKYKDINIKAGKGAFLAIPDELLLEVVSFLPWEDVFSVAATSKAMYNVCQAPCIWQGLSPHNAIDDKSCFKDFFIKRIPYIQMFSDPNKSYTLSVEQILFIQTHPTIEDRNLMPIGHGALMMYNTFARPGQDGLQSVNLQSTLSFSRRAPMFPAFTAYVKLDPMITEATDFSSQEYQTRIAGSPICSSYDDWQAGRVIGNQFVIEKK